MCFLALPGTVMTMQTGKALPLDSLLTVFNIIFQSELSSVFFSTKM